MFDSITSIAPVFALLTFAQIWLAIPLGLAFAFCYAATHEEKTGRIIARALRISATLAIAMAVVALILALAV